MKPFAYEKLEGLDRQRILSAVVPVLDAHRVEGVELIWRTDGRGAVLHLTVEAAGATEPGAGVTLDLCAEISRDLSAAFDVEDVFPGKYRLEVGSPGLDRALYGVDDYRRFSGREAKLRLHDTHRGQKVLRGMLRGVDDAGAVLIEADGSTVALAPDRIAGGQLIFDWRSGGRAEAPGDGGRRGRSRRSQHRNR